MTRLYDQCDSDLTTEGEAIRRRVLDALSATDRRLHVVCSPMQAAELLETLSVFGLADCSTIYGECPEQSDLESAGMEWCTVECSEQVGSLLRELGDTLVWPAGDRDAMCHETDGALR